MHIYFSGIGGAGIGPLALIAKQAGYEVSGSDKQHSDYISYLKKQGIDSISIGQSYDSIKTLHECSPIDWLVYSSAVPKENPDHPELAFAREHHIQATKRDTFLATLLEEKQQQLLAVAGTHGKSTTTAMLVWLFKQLSLPVSYSVGAKLPFGAMGEFSADSAYFVYEADEYDRNFLSFTPELAVISGIDYDHPDIYPTREDYYSAFQDFLAKSAMTVIHEVDAEKLGVKPTEFSTTPANFTLIGEVNRRDAQLAVEAFHALSNVPIERLVAVMNDFPGLSRRFEKITQQLYSDYAHTPEKIRGALQTAREAATAGVVVVYEGLHNTRQHFIRDELPSLFSGIKKLYVVPSYLAREDKELELLTPEKLCSIIEQPEERIPAALDDELKTAIVHHLDQGDLVLCLSAGSGGSLDEWLRKEFK